MISQVVEGRIESTAKDARLARRSALGHARITNRAKGGPGSFGGGDGLWHAANRTGYFVRPSNDQDAADHLQPMRDIAGQLVPAPDSWHGTRPAAINRGLMEAKFVFVRRDASHGPLQTPYTWPYRVLQRKDKHFVIQCGEREESMSVDRLKPANAKPDRPIQPAIPPRRGWLPKQREGRPADDGDQQEPEPEQQPPTYAQVTQR